MEKLKLINSSEELKRCQSDVSEIRKGPCNCHTEDGEDVNWVFDL